MVDRRTVGLRQSVPIAIATPQIRYNGAGNRIDRPAEFVDYCYNDTVNMVWTTQDGTLV